MDQREPKRSKNFADSEVNLLLELVEENKRIIECKKTDCVTVREKKEVWKKLTSEFNERSGLVFRDWKSIKGKYENIKKASKRKFFDEKRYILGTGGGPSHQGTLTETDMRVMELIGEVQMEGMDSQFDSDSMVAINNPETSDTPPTMKDVNWSGTEKQMIIDLNEDVASSMATPYVDTSQKVIDKPDSKFTVKRIREIPSSPLHVKKRRKFSLDDSIAGKKIVQLSREKQKLLLLQKKVYEEQLQIQRVEHELKMRQIHEEHELKMKQSMEEHEIKIKLFKVELERKEFDLMIRKSDYNKK